MSDGLARLLARIDQAVQMPDPGAITARVKQELQDAIRARTVALPERFRRVRSEGLPAGCCTATTRSATRLSS